MGPIRWCPMSAAPADAVALARDVIATAGRHLAAGGEVDDNQVAAYDLAHAAAAVETAAAALDYGAARRGRARASPPPSSPTPCTTWRRGCSGESPPGVSSPGALEGAMAFVRAHRSAEFLASLAGEEGLAPPRR